MIRYSNEEGFIKSKGIKFKEGQDPNIKLPKVAVGVFSRHLFYDVVEKFSCSEVGYISCSNMEREVYIREVANMTDVTYKTLEGQVNRAYSMLARKNSDKEKVKVAQDLRQKTVIKDSSSQACIELEKQLLNLMFYDYEACMYIKENFNFGYFSNEFFLEFASKVLLHREESKTDLKESEFI